MREDLEAINRTARAMADDVPGLEAKFRLPRSGSQAALLAAARAFASDALPLKEEFIAYEMPADFLDDLAANIAAFEQSDSTQDTGLATQVGATAGIDATITAGVRLVRKLDALVRNKYRDDAATLAAWQSASHTERASRATPAPQAPPTTAP